MKKKEEKKKKKIMKLKKKKRRKENEERKTQEELDKEMWEYKRKCEKSYHSKGYYEYINHTYARNEYWRKDDISDSINSSGNFFN